MHKVVVLRVTATSDGGAATSVRISICTWLAVVVGSTPPRAWHGVTLQRLVAYILRGC
ncbi:hypothetical protein JHK82_054275 [Glycine max]|nr:hypothetical protein JHK86_054122 [Glycine max]KAG4916623.1 hypothetical protein JHK87_054180 [Glycine soja]KAG4928594.1 hypothetical protein JHK85_055080 [Glycine max]KAG5086878.1 hypothetical protein JHK82_054275 [Glycine max]KHN43521.1 hypothetical protein glysoja_002104 [Glycine soja]